MTMRNYYFAQVIYFIHASYLELIVSVLFLVVSAVLVVTLGRLGDIYGRVRMYNAGFAIFGLGALALPFDPFIGPKGALWLIGFRVIQATGGAMLMANSPAILTDAFPANQRGTALGMNAIAAIAGSFLGLLLGGVLGRTGAGGHAAALRGQARRGSPLHGGRLHRLPAAGRRT